MTLSSLLCLVLAAPVGDKPADQLIGKWHGKDKVGEREARLAIEFNRDGTIIWELQVDKLTLRQSGTYKFVTDTTLEIETLQRDKVVNEKNKVKVSTDKLVLTDDKGVVREFTRPKSLAQDLIVGKWSAKETLLDEKLEIEMIFEFTKDGKLSVEMKGLPLKLEGTYKILDDTILEVTMKGPDGKENTEKSSFSVTADKLTKKDPAGEATVMTRVK